MGFRLAFAIAFAMAHLAGMTATAVAAGPSPRQKLEACLKKAEDLPDIAEANASTWLKHGGGEPARFCHAAAQFNREEFSSSAHEFAALAALHDKNDPRHAAELHARAGLGFMRANDNKNAENEYATALKLEPDDPEIWVDRATERAAAERYWDAISDLNHALGIMPDMADALRLRGQAWMKLGNSKNAAADFNAAGEIDAADKTVK